MGRRAISSRDRKERGEPAPRRAVPLELTHPLDSRGRRAQPRPVGHVDGQREKRRDRQVPRREWVAWEGGRDVLEKRHGPVE